MDATKGVGMTARAAPRVLADCRLAHRLLEDEADVDQEPKMKLASSAAFKRWRLGAGEDAIFTHFIEAERNTILKEYSFRTDLQDSVPVCVGVDGADQLFPLNENLFRPMTDGFGAGEDARDVYLQAIQWWEKEIAEIERQAGSR